MKNFGFTASNFNGTSIKILNGDPSQVNMYGNMVACQICKNNTFYRGITDGWGRNN